MRSVHSFRVLILGDFYFGESFPASGARELEVRGYLHSTEHLNRFVDASDVTCLNLEAPLVGPKTMTSSPKGKKSGRWANPEGTTNALRALGVDAVNLANDHILDYGREGLESTLGALADAGIGWFGAGKTLDEARAPYRVTLPEWAGSGEIHFHGSFQYPTRSDRDDDVYAGHDSPGCAPLALHNVPHARLGEGNEDTFHVAFPHWGASHQWRNQDQYKLAHRFLKKEYDLVVGHGSHSIQEVHRKQQRWVVYGIGNGIFNSRGRWDRAEAHDIPPVSLWAVLEVSRRHTHRTLTLKLYPVYSNNAVTNFQPGPVSAPDFEQVVETLASRPIRPWRFNNPARTAGVDDLGHFLALDLGVWPEGKRPSRLEAPTAGGDPNEWPLRSPGLELEDKILGLDKQMGAGALALGAEADGGSTHWLTREVAVIEAAGKRMLTEGARAHESALGSAIVGDKVLTAELLEERGVATPMTVLVESPDGAVGAARTFEGPVVVKPRYGKKSKGVSTGLVEDQGIRAAYDLARKHGGEVIMQQHLEAAEELRVMASPDRAVAVNRRVLPHVIGDGVSSVRQLIEDKNLQRTLNPSVNGMFIPLDTAVERQLEDIGLDLEAVPHMGQCVTVRNFGGVSVGADIFQNLEGATPELLETSRAAIAAIPGLGWGGVDVIIEESTGKPHVIEINTKAGYISALFPTYGEPRDVGADVWRLRFDATLPDPDALPDVAWDTPRAVATIRELVDSQNDESVKFRRVFRDSLRRQHYTLRSRGRLLQAISPEGDHQWVTRLGLMADDRAVARQVVKRHDWVSELLDLAGVPRVPSRTVTSAQELAEFVRRRGEPVILTGVEARWNGPDSHLVTAREASGIASLSGKLWVQERPEGQRVRILATRGKSWVMTARPGAEPLSRNSAQKAGQLAVRAVRAVPELRWAAVDILVRPRRLRPPSLGKVVVEGLAQEPEYALDDEIVAGDLDEFCRTIIKSFNTR